MHVGKDSRALVAEEAPPLPGPYGDEEGSRLVRSPLSRARGHGDRGTPWWDGKGVGEGEPLFRGILLEVRLDRLEVAPRDRLQDLVLADRLGIVGAGHEQRLADDPRHLAGAADGRALWAEQVVVAALPQDLAVG